MILPSRHLLTVFPSLLRYYVFFFFLPVVRSAWRRTRMSLGFFFSSGCVDALRKAGLTAKFSGFHRPGEPRRITGICVQVLQRALRSCTTRRRGRRKKENSAAKPHRRRFRRVVCFTSCLRHVHFSQRGKRGGKRVPSMIPIAVQDPAVRDAECAVPLRYISDF